MGQQFKTIFLALSTLLLTLSLILYPEESLHASIRGLHTWGEVVFPSLLPFFIMAELLISFGIVQFVGVLFEPIMRPIFNVPGVGSFAWMVGMASGYPSGAKISASLREKEEISRIEAERLVSFSNASSPLFIFGAIAVGFLHNAELGLLIAVCHYVSNMIVGICMRFYGKQRDKQKIKLKSHKNLIIRAFRKMHDTRLKDDRPIGQILGDAVISSIQSLIMVGGFIMLFSVITTLLNVIHVTDLISAIINPVLLILQVPVEITVPVITGIFEMTMGIEMISKLTGIPLVIQLAVISFILGFNGFSIQAQVASILAKTDIRFLPYFFARLLHAVIACLFTIILYKTYFENKLTIEDAIAIEKSNHSYQLLEYLTSIGPIITIGSTFLAVCILGKRLIKS